jgi:hypothetical protein
MRLRRPQVALILTDDERVRLDSAHRGRTAPYLARRARISLACADGQDNTAVAKRLRMSHTTLCKWRGRSARGIGAAAAWRRQMGLTDPLLIEKVRDIVGLYMQPPTHALV